MLSSTLEVIGIVLLVATVLRGLRGFWVDLRDFLAGMNGED